jgi:hypothetical protein
MPSMAHEILVDLFRNRPSLAAEILVEVLGVPLPAYSEARVSSADLTEIQPAEYRADVVVLLFHEGAPVRVVVVEVQLAIDPKKRFSWPAYAAVSRAVHGCPAALWSWRRIQPSPVGAPNRSRSASRGSSCARRCCAARPFRW